MAGLSRVFMVALVVCASNFSRAQDIRLANQNCTVSSGDVYHFSEKKLNSTEVVTLSQFKGKYHELNALQQEHQNELVVLGFPCNQFGKQEPGGTDFEILNGIRYVRPGNDFQPQLTLFQKIDVNGEKEHPLFSYLKASCPPTRETFAKRESLFYDSLRSNDIRWNFEKFLIDRQGKPVKRYDAATRPSEIKQDINNLVIGLLP